MKKKLHILGVLKHLCQSRPYGSFLVFALAGSSVLVTMSSCSPGITNGSSGGTGSASMNYQSTGSSYYGQVGVAVNITPTISVSSGVTISNCALASGSTNASKFPSTLTINSTTCAISGVPTQAMPLTQFTVQLTTNQSNTSTATVSFSVSGSADHLVLFSGNKQNGSAGTAMQPLQVQVVDQNGSVYPGGIALRIEDYSENQFYGSLSQTQVTTNGNGIASFSGYFQSSQTVWGVVPVTSLPGTSLISFTETPNMTGSGSFGSETTFPAGSSSDDPVSVAVGDFNKDGKLDLVVVNTVSNTISILLGNGDGTFQSQTTYSTGASSGSLQAVVADFNQDNKLDIAVTNPGNQNVGIFLGNGDGTFQNQVTYGVGSAQRSVAVGDINRDGYLDLALTGGSGVSTLIGNGDGTFKAATNWTGTHNFPNSIALGDLNGDGFLDIGVANWSSSDFSVSLNNGNGTYPSSPTNYNTTGAGDGPQNIHIADVNGDGIMDMLVTAENTNQGVCAMLGNGDGTFVNDGGKLSANHFYFFDVGDINGDKIPDVVGFDDNGTLFLKHGNGDGTFAAGTTISTGVAGPGRVSNISKNPIVLADFNGDGKLDIAVVNNYANNVGILLGQ